MIPRKHTQAHTHTHTHTHTHMYIYMHIYVYIILEINLGYSSFFYVSLLLILTKLLWHKTMRYFFSLKPGEDRNHYSDNNMRDNFATHCSLFPFGSKDFSFRFYLNISSYRHERLISLILYFTVKHFKDILPPFKQTLCCFNF